MLVRIHFPLNIKFKTKVHRVVFYGVLTRTPKYFFSLAQLTVRLAQFVLEFFFELTVITEVLWLRCWKEKCFAMLQREAQDTFLFMVNVFQCAINWICLNCVAARQNLFFIAIKIIQFYSETAPCFSFFLL